LKLGTVTLLADDAPTYRAYSTSVGLSVPPGFVETTEVAFEVDPARIADLTLNLEPTEIVSGYQQHAQIHLGITAANAADWAAGAEGRTVEAAAD
ncbi:hypothetical protein, partial [Acinetobacter baumannii]|uniref:hypothetical protein n=1 Tax=Acinetobacter baumannii TaxID=470 RepID=UPI0031F3553D